MKTQTPLAPCAWKWEVAFAMQILLHSCPPPTSLHRVRWGRERQAYRVSPAGERSRAIKPTNDQREHVYAAHEFARLRLLYIQYCSPLLLLLLLRVTALAHAKVLSVPSLFPHHCVTGPHELRDHEHSICIQVCWSPGWSRASAFYSI